MTESTPTPEAAPVVAPQDGRRTRHPLTDARNPLAGNAPPSPDAPPHRSRHQKTPATVAPLDATGALPLDGEVVNLDALASVFGMTPSGARRAVLRGEFGPYSRVGRGMFLRRTSVLATLAAREFDPGPPPTAPPVPEAPAWARELLRPGRRSRK